MSHQSVLVDGAADGLEIVCFPGEDREFVTTVRQIADDIAPRAHGHDFEDALGTALAARYPAVRLRRRDALASRGETGRIVYAFRDGTAARSNTVNPLDDGPVTLVSSAGQGSRTRG